MIQKTGFTAEDIGDYFFDVLESYGRTYADIEFISGDNASVNGRLADLLQSWLREKRGINRVIPLIGCASHRLNLAVQSLYAEGTDFYNAVNKVNSLMVELGSLKNTFKLRVKTSLCVIKRNDTRWGSTFAMLKRYLDLQPVLPQCSFKRDCKDKFLTVPENRLINELADVLHKCERVSIFLQTNDAHKVNLLSVRIAFDDLIAEIPELESKLGPNAAVVHNPQFENAIVKLQKGEELSTNEKRVLSVFKCGAVVQSEGDEERLSYEERLLRRVEESKTPSNKRNASFRNTFHVSPTSNIVERLFSRAGLVMRPHRRSMDPSTLEMLFLLRFNKDLWAEKTLQGIIDRKKRENQERARQRREEEALKRLADELAVV